MDYKTALAEWTPEQWQAFGSVGGVIGENDQLVLDQGLTGNTQIDYANSAGLGGLTQGTWNNLGQAAGLAGGMYNMYDSMFGNKADLYKQQIGNLKDQRAYNAQTIANQKQFKSNIGSGFSGAFSNGLAASRVG